MGESDYLLKYLGFIGGKTALTPANYTEELFSIMGK